MTTFIYNDDYENPFKSTNADTMSYEQIVNSWSAPFSMRGKNFSEDIYLNTPMSLIISGARGTGKTMIFKYYSFQAQAILAGKKGISILEHYKKCKSISFYLKFDPYILQSFKNDDKGMTLFTHFFELVVCESYIEFVNMLKNKDQISVQIYEEICKAIVDLLGPSPFSDDLEEYIEFKINEIYQYMSNLKMKNTSFDVKKIYSFKSLSYKIKEILCKKISELNGLYFLWIIDEGENFLEFEQKAVNCFIKTLNSRMNRDIFLRFGTREPQIKTYETINIAEFLTIGRDFEFKDINYYTINSEDRKDYSDWLYEIAENRLKNCKVFNENNNCDIRLLLGNKENQCDEAKKCAANKKRHFNSLLKDNYSDKLYELLKVKDNPLLEMMNIFWYKKGHTIEEIKIGVNGYLQSESAIKNDEEIANNYKNTFLHNKVAFLYLLLSKYKKEKKYYSFQTYSYLSIGNVSNYIKLCREAFDNAYFEDRELLFSGKISIKAQHEATISVAYDEIEKVKYIPKYGKNLYSLVVNLGNLFNEYHCDNELRFIEQNQFVVFSDSEYVKELINTGLTWGVFLKKIELQTIDSNGNKGTIYTLNKMFCPLFGISYRSKGRGKTLIDESTFIQLTSIQNRKVSSMIGSDSGKSKDEQQIPGQISIFDGDDYGII